MSDPSMSSNDGHTTSDVDVNTESDDWRTTDENGIPVNYSDSADNQPEQGYDASEWNDHEPPEQECVEDVRAEFEKHWATLPTLDELKHKLGIEDLICEHPPDACAALVFNLDTTEGERRMRECLDSSRIKLALWSFDQYLRGRIKYPNDTPKAEDLIEELECVRRKLWSICDGRGIRLDEE